MDGWTEARTEEGVAAPARRIPAEVFAARREAREILRLAANEAEGIVTGARDDAARIRQEAGEAGLREGLERAAADVARGSRERQAALDALAPRVLEVAVALAERVLGRAVVPGADGLRAAREALAELSAEGRAVLRVSPADLQAVRDPGGSFGASGRHLVIVEDARLAPGEVVVEAGGRRVDGRFSAQLEVLARALREEQA